MIATSYGEIKIVNNIC